ncbi:MAG: TonB-dependent receptor, partial [Novosphingobium sp.]
PEYRTTGKFSVDLGQFTGGGVKSAIHVRTNGFVTTPLVDDVLAVSLSGSYEYSPGYLTDVLTGNNTGVIRSWTARGKILFEPADGIRFLLSGYTAKRRDASGSVAATTGISVASRYPDAVLPTKPWQVASELARSQQLVDTRSRGASLKADFEIGEAGTLSSLTSYSYTNGTVLAEVDGAYAPSCVAVFACISPYAVEFGPSKTLQQEVTFTSNDIGPVHFTVGGMFYRDKSGLSSWVNPPLVNGHLSGGEPYGAPYYTNTYVKTKALAGFGELTWNVTDALHLTGGLRYSWEERSGFGSVLGGPLVEFGNKPSWESWTPRVSLRYDLSNQANVYATYSKGFKSGVLNALNLSDDIAEPETLTSYEVGFKYAGPRASLNVAAFYYDYKNLQIQFFLGLANTIGNADSARIYGLDVDGTFNLTDDLSIRAAGSWVPHAKYRNYRNGVAFVYPMGPYGLTTDAAVDASGTRLLKTPRFTGNVTLNYDRETADGGKVDANVTLYYSSGFNWNLVHRARTDRYATVSAQVGYSPANSGARFGVYARNLTNKAFVTSTTLSAEGDTFGYGAPRELGLSLSYQF